MCLYPKLITNRKYISNKKNGGNIPYCKDERIKKVAVGCGNCIECRKQKAREWQIRLTEEIKKDNKCYFVTMTFSNEELKKLCKETHKQECNMIATIGVRRFLENFRRTTKKSIKHWLITELGHTNTERIHLHGIMWDGGISDFLELIQKKWKYGIIDIGTYCNLRTVNYIVKYVTKIDFDHKNYKPVILCSKGIGSNFVNDGTKGIYKYKPLETREWYKLSNGYKVNLPIYYRNKFFNEDERENLWLEKLDKEEIWILGNKYSIKTNDEIEIYYNVLRTCQEWNKLIGYGDDTQEWKKQAYNITLRMLNKAMRAASSRKSEKNKLQ